MPPVLPRVLPSPQVAAYRSEARRLDNLARIAELNGGHVPERRDPTAATLSSSITRYQSPGQPMVAEWDAATAIQWAFYANVIVYRCMQILANTVAACPFRAGLTLPKQPGAQAEFDVKARLAQLLGPPPGGPAPKLTARRLWMWTVVQRKVTGRHGWEIETTGRQGQGEVVALWPLMSSILKPIPSDGGVSWWSKFEYGTDPATKRTLTTDQVLYGWDPSAKDFRQAESALQAARLDVSIAVMMDRYSVGFLRNDARPAAVVVTEAFNSDDDFRRWKSQWYGEYGGPDNANKTAFIETDPDGQLKPSEALNVFPLGLSQKDARFIEQHQASLERIAMACGVPWSKLDASGRTFDNAGEEDETFWMLTMLPLLSDLADEANMQLAERVGRELGWFDLSHVKVFQPSKTVQPVGADVLYKNRIANKNESRDLVGLPPVDGGDEFITDDELATLEGGGSGGGVLPAAAAGEPVEQRALEHSHMHTHADGTIHAHAHRHAAGTDEHGDWAEGVVHGHGHTLAKRSQLHRGRRPRTETQHPNVRAGSGPFEQRETDLDAQERRARIWRANDATVRTLETRWTKAIRKLFDRQQRAVIARLGGNRGRRAIADGTNPDELFDSAYWATETEDDVAALYELVTSAGFARMSNQFGIAFDLEAEFAQQFIQERANKLAGAVTDTTYTAIKDALAEGVNGGESIPELADRIRHVFDIATTSRSEMIARTEVISAFNGSASLAATQLPDDVVGGQEWIATISARTRDDHAEADGQIIQVGEAFDVGGEQLAYPGDPNGSPENVINCRCAVGFLTPDEMNGRSSKVTSARAALAALEQARPGRPFDELAVRRTLKQETAA